MRDEKTIAVVGGSGYIGQNLATHLARGFHTKIVDVKVPSEELPTNIEYVSCDIRRSNEVRRALEGVNVVVHTAIIQIPFLNEQRRAGYEVNIIGTQNVCSAVDENPDIEGMILTSSWHTVGETGLKGIVNEGFGFRPDKVENRARLYVLCKIAQECLIRIYDEMSDKTFGIIRLGTVLGSNMPADTAAQTFIQRGLRGDPITPYEHDLHRPMLYVDISDVCLAFERFIMKILSHDKREKSFGPAASVNVYYPRPITILELAEIVKESVIRHTENTVKPEIEIVDKGKDSRFSEGDKDHIDIDISRAIKVLGLANLKSPKESIGAIVRELIRNSAQ